MESRNPNHQPARNVAAGDSLNFIRFPLFPLAILPGLRSPVSARVTIEIVNDRGLPDGNVFVKAPGYYFDGHTSDAMAPAGLVVDLSNLNPPNPASAPSPAGDARRREAPESAGAGIGN